MDIKAKIEEIIAKVKDNPDLLSNLTSDPAGTIKDIIGIDVSEEQISSIINGIKEKINLDDIAGGLGEKVKDLVGNAGGLGDTVKNIIGNAGDSLGDAVKGITEEGGLGDTVKNILGGAGDELTDKVKDAVEDAGEKLGGGLLGGIGEKLSGLFGGKKDDE